MTAGGDVLDDLFHACAWAAFLAEARAAGGWPEPEPTRRRAYRLYEDALAGTGRGGAGRRPGQLDD